jgi:hypothetical protein
MSTYSIADEPRPSTTAHLTVHPLWPLFAIMFGGGWLAFPWFAFNSIAMGSPFRRRELALAAGGILAPMVAVTLVSMAIGDVSEDWLSRNAAYIVVLRITIQLGFAYALYTLQARTFGIYQYYGGVARNGMLVVFAGYFLRGPIIDAVSAAAPILYWGLS